MRCGPFSQLIFSLLTAVTFLAITSTSAMAEEKQPDGATPFDRVVKVNIDQEMYSFTRLPNLMQIYRAAELEPAAYWPVSRLLSQKQTRKVHQQRQALLKQLNGLAQWTQTEGDTTYAAKIKKWHAAVSTWPLIGAEWLGYAKIVDRKDEQSGVSIERPSFFSSFTDAVSSLKYNPTLPEGTYRFLPPREVPSQWHTTLVTAEGAQKVTFSEQDTVRDLLERSGILDKHHALASVDLVFLTGHTESSNVAYYENDNAMPPVGGLILVDLPKTDLPEQWQSLGQQLVELARYWNPQS
ncbi:capsule biosynthesis GfcC family protein [Pseudidiomarina homiensis]|uniref:capsule biosynthesis GfcC family protein n=1 Tax=Pseudidiomarina homiensis TaxID=364198 RepID=UPI00215AFF15|nr:capsule biosynthesis GfcC family protein [Pseudidiomarina homiensis]